MASNAMKCRNVNLTSPARSILTERQRKCKSYSSYIVSGEKRVHFSEVFVTGPDVYFCMSR